MNLVRTALLLLGAGFAALYVVASVANVVIHRATP